MILSSNKVCFIFSCFSAENNLLIIIINKMVRYSDIDEFEIRNPKVFLGFAIGSIIFLVGFLCKEQFMNTTNLFST